MMGERDACDEHIEQAEYWQKKAEAAEARVAELEADNAELTTGWGDDAEQRVMIVQVPSEANAEKLLNTRLRDAQAEGWHITSMMDHNGFLVWLLERSNG